MVQEETITPFEKILMEVDSMNGDIGNMIASKVAIDMIKGEEGFSSTVYVDTAGHTTIGHGKLLHYGPPTEHDKQIKWTREHAENMLRVEVVKIEQALNKAVKVKLTQNQFDALVVWTYNLGTGWLNEDKCSWLRVLNLGEYDRVPTLMKRFNKELVNGEFRINKGLASRREREANLFIKP